MLTSPLLDHPAIVHGFGTRHDGMAALLPDYWARRAIQHERHGTRIAIVTGPNQDCGEADGMLTASAGLLLAIATADCVPVLLARHDGREVAALHVGWRGAHAGIVDRFAALVRERGGDPADWIAAIGPAAHACCYEVSPELIEDFRARTALPLAAIAPRPRRLDLPAIVRWQLGQAGIKRVSMQAECTMCMRGDGGRFVYHSYRRDRETRTPMVDVQWSAIA
ncbi:polyphenol oxidase family protein, partial [Massilia sp. LXY-6]|uniref:polyphenol oxidase family protein n=1 Tax=Massilia sp. LXY-6 TaxID=3379823 RepID=UPI003EE3D39C